MADRNTQIRKLIALALNNPNEQEAAAAAMKAVRMIGAGGDIPTPISSATKTYVRDEEFEAFWDRMNNPDVSADDYPAGGPTDLKAAAVDTELDDDFMRKRITRAWRAIRKERKILEGEIDRYERNTRQRYPKPDWRD